MSSQNHKRRVNNAPAGTSPRVRMSPVAERNPVTGKIIMTAENMGAFVRKKTPPANAESTHVPLAAGFLSFLENNKNVELVSILGKENIHLAELNEKNFNTIGDIGTWDTFFNSLITWFGIPAAVSIRQKFLDFSSTSNYDIDLIEEEL